MVGECIMGLDDFKKIQEKENVEDERDEMIENIDIEDIEYYLSHLDELLKIVKDNHFKYVNAKLKYELKKDDLQVNTNWNDENTLRVANGLPKITNQDQRNAIINMKLKPLHKKMKSCEVEYKIYSKLFSFISNNFDLLCIMYGDDEK